jgi:predicted DNA binding CopG/RHH family protein
MLILFLMKNTTISIVIPESLKEAIKVEAKNQKRTFSNLIRKILLESVN